jgi:hypothetical protein
VVLAVLTPAASIVTLDVVGSGPAGATLWPTRRAYGGGYTAEAVRPSKVPTAPVKPDVREVQLTSAVATAGRAVPTPPRPASWPRPTAAAASPRAQRVTGFGEVGVTWAHGVAIPAGGIAVAVRTRTHGTWTGWRTIPYDPSTGPTSPRPRPGARGPAPSRCLGTVGRVQVRAVSKRPCRRT